MKNRISYLWIIAAILHVFMFSACKDETEDELTAGISLKSYMPTAVMAGSEMVITGTNLNQITALLFPGDIEVTDFEIVTSNQIKVTVPTGIAEEGGTLKLVSTDQIIESAVAMRLARPKITVMEPGDQVKELQILTFKGEDLECIKQVAFPSAETEQEIVVDAISFVRKSSDNVKVWVPVGVKNGVSTLRLIAVDGSILQSQEINLIANVELPEGTTIATIQNAASGLYLTRNSSEDAPKIMTQSGSLNQEFSFIPVDGKPETYYIKNNETDEYLICIDESTWQMKWESDPTTLPNPDKGMYQIVPIEGVSEYVQIKNMGSKMLGTDDVVDNSEVYADKENPTEPKFQWKINVISGPGFDTGSDTDSKVIWEGEVKSDDPEGGEGWLSFKLESSHLSDLAVGQTIRLYYNLDERNYAGYWQQGLSGINLRSGNGENDLTFGDPQITDFKDTQLTDVGYYDLVVTQAVYDCINPNGTSPGLLIRGWKYILTKVELILPDETDSNVLWEGEVKSDHPEGGEGWLSFKIEPIHLSNLAVGQTIRMYYKFDERNYAGYNGQGLSGINLRSGNDNYDLTFGDPQTDFQSTELTDVGYYDLVVTQAVYDCINPNGTSPGFLIRGWKYILTKVELI